MKSRLVVVLAFVCANLSSTAQAQDVKVHEEVLDNGLRVLLVPRPGDPNISAGWVARVGSVNERPGITGIAHLFEHMMFKGTRTLGTSDIEKDLATIVALDDVKSQLAKEEESLVRRWRLGEIEDFRDPAARSDRHQELRKDFELLLAEQKKTIVKDEFDKVYSAAGASGMNAGTTYDFTIYFINVPATKLELWFWMESDRLLNPVFREFYSERDVVREERRLRVESTPTGKFREQFDSLFWGSSPYGWPVIGWPSDVEAINREEAREFYSVYYAPNNLTACLVGDFDPKDAVALAKKYFGRLERSPREVPTVRTLEVPQLAPKRMVASAETKPQVSIRWHTVADGHRDEPALVILQDILNGRTGRLFKTLVEQKRVATSARAGQTGRKYEGYFSITGVAADGKTPEEVEKELLAVVESIQTANVSERELQKVKNQHAASEFRKLRSNFSLLLDLLVRDSGRGWRTINNDPPKYQAVTVDDVRRVANTYFHAKDSSTLTFHTAAPTSDAPLEAPPEAPTGKESNR
jgi:predicted Zn-dependent peptidase